MRTPFLGSGDCTRMRDKNGQLALSGKGQWNLSVRLDQKQKSTKNELELNTFSKHLNDSK